MNIIIVLGSALQGEKLSPETKGRVDRALDIYDELSEVGPVMMILSGGGNRKISEAEAMGKYIQSTGRVPKDNVIEERNSNNTIENIINTTEIINELAQDNDIKNTTYVSSDYHIPRISEIHSYFGPSDIPVTFAGSMIFPESRIENEKKILANLQKAIERYLQ